jgi:hypothetical protein
MRTAGSGMAPGIVLVFWVSVGAGGRALARLRDLVVAPWVSFCCDIVSGCSLCTAEVSWLIVYTQPFRVLCTPLDKCEVCFIMSRPSVSLSGGYPLCSGYVDCVL